VVLTALATSYGTQFFVRRVPRPTTPPTAVGDRVLVDVRPAGTDLDTLMEFAGLIARGDDGVVVPFTTPPPGQKETGRLRIAEAETAAADAGHDSEGIARVSESFTNGALELVEEVDASMIVLSWGGPRLGSDYVFGHEIDEVGVQSPVASVATHLIRPWKRVVLVTGNARVRWHADDAALAVSVAGRVRRGKDSPILVIGSDLSHAEDGLGAPENVEYVEARNGAHELLERVEPDDLVIAPSYVLRSVPINEQLRLARRMAQVDLAVVAGPYRLSVGRRTTPHRMEGLLGPQQ
jgi:hypothetical protein